MIFAGHGSASPLHGCPRIPPKNWDSRKISANPAGRIGEYYVHVNLNFYFLKYIFQPLLLNCEVCRIHSRARGVVQGGQGGKGWPAELENSKVKIDLKNLIILFNFCFHSMLRQQEEDVPPEAPADGAEHEHEQPAEEANI